MPLLPKIQAFVDSKHLTQEQAKKLGQRSIRLLEISGVSDFISADITDVTPYTLTMTQLLRLNHYAGEAFEDPAVRNLITTGRLTMLQVQRLTDAASQALRDPAVRGFISADITPDTLTIQQVLELTDAASQALRDPAVRGFISADITPDTLTIQQVLELTDVASQALRDPAVRGFISADITPDTLTIQQVLELTDVASQALRDPAVRGFITADALTMPQVLTLTDAAFLALQDPALRAFISADITPYTLTIQQVLELTDAASQALRDPALRNFTIMQRRLTMPQVLELTKVASQVLRTSKARDLIRVNVMSMAEALTLNSDATAKAFLCIDDLSNFLIKGGLTISDLENLTATAFSALQNYWVLQLIEEGRLTIAQVLELTETAYNILSSEDVCDLIHSEKLTVQAVLALNEHASKAITFPSVLNLMNNYDNKLIAEDIAAIGSDATVNALKSFRVCDLIRLNFLKIQEVLELTDAASRALQDDEVCVFIRREKVSVADVLELTDAVSETLRNPVLNEFITQGHLTIANLRELTNVTRQALKTYSVCYFIRNGRLTLPQVLELTEAASRVLSNNDLFKFINDGRLTMAQVLALTNAASRALCDPDVRGFISSGRLTMAEVLALTDTASNTLLSLRGQQMLRENLQITLEEICRLLLPVRNINDAQSTHNTSVHRTVSESATRLAARYQSIIDAAGLESVIDRVKAYVDSLSEESLKNRAAKECILRITDPGYTFTDTGSQITTKQLLALTFSAIEDEDNRSGTLEDARAQFVEGLYEIQRGYNLSATGADQGGADRPICCAGTFNKLIEKLQSIHPDCQILFITGETVSFKLPKVVEEEVMGYMKSLASPETVEELQAFTRLISQVKEEGLEVIWNQIRDKIGDRMFDEFGSLYEDRADQSFTDLIDAGQFAELPDLSVFQEQIQNSKGYHQYGSEVLRQSARFFSPEKVGDYLSERRHDNPEAQREYDQQFGLLVLRK